MKDRIGDRLFKACFSSESAAHWKLHAHQTPSSKMKRKWERRAASFEGDAAGHAFRAAELAYDKASLEFGSRHQRILGLEQANREAHQCIARLKRQINSVEHR